MILETIKKSFLYFSSSKYDKIKLEVVRHVSMGKKYWKKDDSIFMIDNVSLHVRFAKNNWFSITPPDKETDFTLWIIDSINCYYLIPNHIISEIKNNSTTYEDRRYGYKIVTIDCKTNMCSYAIGGRKTDFTKYRNAFL